MTRRRRSIWDGSTVLCDGAAAAALGAGEGVEIEDAWRAEPKRRLATTVRHARFVRMQG
jgi:hypothetical protein